MTNFDWVYAILLDNTFKTDSKSDTAIPLLQTSQFPDARFNNQRYNVATVVGNDS